MSHILSKRVRQCLFSNLRKLSLPGSAGHCRPRFSFFHIQLSKNRHHVNAMSRANSFWLKPCRVSLTRLSLDNSGANDLVASGAPPSLWGVYRLRYSEVSTAFFSIMSLFFQVAFSPPVLSVRPRFFDRYGHIRNAVFLYQDHCCRQICLGKALFPVSAGR
jgi:hypothetical protein